MHMAIEIFKLINSNDLNQIRTILAANPGLANDGVSLDSGSSKKGHPLHRICDAVFAKKPLMNKLLKLQKYF
jgi:hypothetical protein